MQILLITILRKSNMNYEIVKSNISDENIKAYSNLLSQVFAKTKKFTNRFLRWQYVENPNGTVIGSDAFFNGLLVAHHATIPVKYNFFGNDYLGLLAINNVTHPEHRGKGLLTALGKATFDEAQRLQYQFVITVTNNNSTYAYLNKFEFKQISQLDVVAGMGKIISIDDNLHQVYSIWSKELLAWRCRNPASRYYINGKSIIAKTNIPLLYTHIKTCNNLDIDNLGLKTRKSCLNVWIGLSKKVKTNGIFLHMPEKLKPSPLNLLFRDLQGNIPSFNSSNIKFDVADFDAF